MKWKRVSVLAIGIALLALLACRAETDRESYVVGDVGTATFTNDFDSGSGRVAFLGGCSSYAFEKLEGERWIDRGPPHVCIWEGFAQAVAPGTSRADPLPTSEPGIWRLRYRTGLGCSPSAPLGRASCAVVAPIYSARFSVAGVCEPAACGPPLGMPNWLCPDGESVGGPTGRCLGDPETAACGWEIAECPE